MNFAAVVRADGRLRRFDVESETRFHAARYAVQCAKTEFNRPLVESVSVTLPQELLANAPDESQGSADVAFTIAVRQLRGVVCCIGVRAENRRAAVKLAEASLLGKAVAATAHFRVLGNCGRCEIPLFADMKVRQAGGGVWKCFECD